MAMFFFLRICGMTFADIWSNDIQRKVGVFLPSGNWFRFQKDTQNLSDSQNRMLGNVAETPRYFPLL